VANLEIKEDSQGVSFSVRVSPRASRSEINGVHAGALKVSLTAPPVEGEANAALCELLAKRLGVAKRAVTVVRGERGKSKTVRVQGVQARAVLSLVSE
jgi:uncharacterized protein (TIGR00251 family)